METLIIIKSYGSPGFHLNMSQLLGDMTVQIFYLILAQLQIIGIKHRFECCLTKGSRCHVAQNIESQIKEKPNEFLIKAVQFNSIYLLKNITLGDK